MKLETLRLCFEFETCFLFFFVDESLKISLASFSFTTTDLDN